MTFPPRLSYQLDNHFNSHPHEEDDFAEAGKRYRYLISTHILTKRMTDRYIQLCYMFQYFNSHPHEEDDNFNNLLRSGIDISTHILTKRMTEVDRVSVELIPISTHILTKRMTWNYAALYRNCLFQLTSSRRGWLVLYSRRLMNNPFQLTSSRRGWLY